MLFRLSQPGTLSKLYLKRRKRGEDPELFTYHLCIIKSTTASKVFKYVARSLLPITGVKQSTDPDLISAPERNQMEQIGSVWIYHLLYVNHSLIYRLRE